MSKAYGWWSYAYKRSWATVDQLRKATAQGQITADEYKTITGTDYTAA